MNPLSGQVCGARNTGTRDRNGARGPIALPGPLTSYHTPRKPTAGQHFDALVEHIIARLEPELRARAPSVDIVIDHVPILPTEWDQNVPLCSIAEGNQVAVFRRPHLDRVTSGRQLPGLIWDSVLASLSEIWQVDVRELDPR